MTDLLAYNFNLETSGFLSASDPAQAFHHIGQSFMHDLAREGDVLSAEVVFDAGGEIDHPDDAGRRPLHEAAFFGHIDMVRFLVCNGAVVDAPVHPFGYTALYFAVLRGNADVARYLIARGARLNIADRLTGHGLLHLAAQNGDMRMAGILIAAGADVFMEDAKGMTARDYAARAREKTLEGVLLKVVMHHAAYGA
jgi:ankyrin repeat protein